MEQHISTKQVCLLLGISLSTFYRYCKAGLLKPAFLTSGKHRRFSLSQLRQSFHLDNNNSKDLKNRTINDNDLVIVKHYSGRLKKGAAYLKSMLPNGFDVNNLSQ